MIAKLLPLVVLAGVVFVVFRNLGKGGAPTAPGALGAALKTFLERTGYRMLGAPDESLEAHVTLATAAMAPMWAGQPYEFTMSRDYLQTRQEYAQALAVNDQGGVTVWANWSLKREDQEAYVGFQVAAKSLTSTLKKGLTEALTRQHRQFSVAYSTKFKCGDAELDAAFDFFAEQADLARVQRALAAEGVKQALLSLTEVSVVVNDEGVIFNDPSQKNLLAGVGGTAGLMAINGDAAKYYDLVAPTHDTIGALLAVIDRASREAAGSAVSARPASVQAVPPPRVLRRPAANSSAAAPVGNRKPA